MVKMARPNILLYIYYLMYSLLVDANILPCTYIVIGGLYSRKGFIYLCGYVVCCLYTFTILCRVGLLP